MRLFSDIVSFINVTRNSQQYLKITQQKNGAMQKVLEKLRVLTKKRHTAFYIIIKPLFS